MRKNCYPGPRCNSEMAWITPKFPNPFAIMQIAVNVRVGCDFVGMQAYTQYMLALCPMSLGAAGSVCTSLPVSAGAPVGGAYLCCLSLLVQQRQPRQVFQERVGGVKNLGQEVETFPLVVIQDLDGTNKDDRRWFKRKSAAKATIHLNIYTVIPLSFPNKHQTLGLLFSAYTFSWNQNANNDSQLEKYTAVIMDLLSSMYICTTVSFTLAWGISEI